MTPSHSSLAVRSYALEYLVGITSEVVANGHHRGIHETDAAALAEAAEFHEEHHVEEHAGHELHEAVVRDGIGKITGKMLTYIKKVIIREFDEL